MTIFDPSDDYLDSPRRPRREPYDESQYETFVQSVLDALGLGVYTVDLSFVPAEDIRNLNKLYRGKDYPTDVLSFPLCEWPSPLLVSDAALQQKSAHAIEEPLLGDIVICPEIAATQAAEIGQSMDREICFLIVHGILHLCGHDHEESADETLMIEQQQLLMKRLYTDALAADFGAGEGQ